MGATVLGWCECGCPCAAHQQHVAGTKLDFCEEHGLHEMTCEQTGP